MVLLHSPLWKKFNVLVNRNFILILKNNEIHSDNNEFVYDLQYRFWLNKKMVYIYNLQKDLWY